MVAVARPRKSLGLRARLPCLLLRPPERTRACPDGIEQRPVALFQRVALGERCAQLEPERAKHAVVAVVALQDDADERRSRSAAGGAELVRDRLAFGGIEFGQRLADKAREMIERLLEPARCRGRAWPACQPGSRDRPRRAPCTRRWRERSSQRQCGGRRVGLRSVHWLRTCLLQTWRSQSKRLARRCFIWSAT